MTQDTFKGYLESRDPSKVPNGWLTYPSRDVFSYKGEVVTRGGLENDGTVATGLYPIHSEFVWKDSLGGERPIRVFGQTVQVKYNSRWYTIFTNLSSTVTRVYFTTWLDGNTSIIHKRLVFSDGSKNLYTWNGAIAEVESATTNSVTFATAGGTCLRRGFDAGNTTNQNILHFIGTGTTSNSEEIYTNDASAQVLNLSGTFNTTPVAGDVIIAKPVTFANAISSTFSIDVVYTYKNHVVAFNFSSPELYFSHVSTYVLATGFDFTMPILASRTALTAIYMKLDSNITAIIARDNILWISDKDDWYKVKKNIAVDEYGLWVNVEKFETGERKGALPMAVANYKGDIVYFAQEGTLQRVKNNEITGKDELMLLSDEVEGLFDRLDKTDVRVKYLTRAIYLVFPNDSTLVMLDMIEEYFQPPQIMPINCISVIDGTLYGHSNVQNETYEMFTGRTDLGQEKTSVIAFGYHSGKKMFRPNSNTIFGVAHKLTSSTNVDIAMEYEEDGSVAKPEWTIDGSTITTFSVADDTSWATNPYGSRSIGGADMITSDLKKAYTYSKTGQTAYFNFRPIFTVYGEENEYHLLAWHTDTDESTNVISKNLFVDK